MAIKGKGKTKTRQVTRAPRPAPVTVKPPLFMRRWVQVTLALVVGVGVMVFAIWVTNGLRDERSKKAAAAREAQIGQAVNVWRATVEKTVARVGQAPNQPSQLFPELNTAISSLAKGGQVKGAEKIATDAQGLADKASSDLSAVKLYEVIRGKGMTLALSNYLLNSQARMAQGLNLYSRAASLVAASTKESDPEIRATLVDEAQQVGNLAGTIYQEGYSDYQQALALSNVFTQQASGLPGGIPISTG